MIYIRQQMRERDIPPQRRVAPLLTQSEIKKIAVRAELATARTFSFAVALRQKRA